MHARAGASHLLAACSSLIAIRTPTEAPMESKAPDKPTARDVWMRGLFMLVLFTAVAITVAGGLILAFSPLSRMPRGRFAEVR